MIFGFYGAQETERVQLVHEFSSGDWIFPKPVNFGGSRGTNLCAAGATGESAESVSGGGRGSAGSIATPIRSSRTCTATCSLWSVEPSVPQSIACIVCHLPRLLIHCLSVPRTSPHLLGLTLPLFVTRSKTTPDRSLRCCPTMHTPCFFIAWSPPLRFPLFPSHGTSLAPQSPDSLLAARDVDPHKTSYTDRQYTPASCRKKKICFIRNIPYAIKK